MTATSTAASPAERRAAPTTAPVVPGAPVVKQTERPHPLTPLIRGWLVFVAICLGWGRQLIPDGEDDGLDAERPALDPAGARRRSWCSPRSPASSPGTSPASSSTTKSSGSRPARCSRSPRRSRSSGCSRSTSSSRSPPGSSGWPSCGSRPGPGDSTTKLRYLTRAKASRLRDYLLTRAHGEQASIGDLDEQAAGQRAHRPRVHRPAAGHGAAAAADPRLPALLGVADLGGASWSSALIVTLGPRRRPVRPGRPDPAGHRGVHHDQPPGDLDVQLHPGRVAPRACGSPAG